MEHGEKLIAAPHDMTNDVFSLKTNTMAVRNFIVPYQKGPPKPGEGTLELTIVIHSSPNSHHGHQNEILCSEQSAGLIF